jgi:hypothetical protein
MNITGFSEPQLILFGKWHASETTTSAIGYVNDHPEKLDQMEEAV